MNQSARSRSTFDRVKQQAKISFVVFTGYGRLTRNGKCGGKGWNTFILNDFPLAFALI